MHSTHSARYALVVARSYGMVRGQVECTTTRLPRTLALRYYPSAGSKVAPSTQVLRYQAKVATNQQSGTMPPCHHLEASTGRARDGPSWPGARLTGHSGRGPRYQLADQDGSAPCKVTRCDSGHRLQVTQRGRVGRSLLPLAVPRHVHNADTQRQGRPPLPLDER